MTLAAKVNATNCVNKLAEEIRNKINTILEPYIGKKVIKITPYKTFIKKISDEMDILRAGYGCSIIFQFYSCSISAEVSYRYSVSEHRTERVTKTIAIAEISFDNLSSLKEPEEYTEYTLEEVEATINKIKELDVEIYALRGKILPFVNR